MASRCYNQGIHAIDIQTISFTADTIKIMLLKSTYSMDPDSQFVSDIVASEVSGATRQTLGSKTVTKDTTNDRDVFDAADPTFPSVTTGQTVGGAAVFKDTGSDATSTLLCFLDTTDTPTNGGDIVVSFSANGIFYGQI
jgi:hypothetical protein